MNETLINLLQQNRAEKTSVERKREGDAVRYGCQWKNTLAGAAARSITI